MDIIFFKIALWGSLISSFFYLLSILVKRVTMAKIGTWFLLAVFFFLTISYGFRCVTTGSSKLLTQHGVMVFFAWAMSGGFLALQLNTKTRVLGALVAPLVSFTLAGASLDTSQVAPLPQALQGSLVRLHVLFILTGEALLILASISGALYLMQNEAIKKKKIGSFTRLLPSLNDLDRLNNLSLIAGFPLLTLGILIGSLWASQVLGSNWQKDPKFIWAALVWLLYGSIIYQRIFLNWKGHRPAVFSLAAFFLLTLSFFAVKYLMPSVHRFI